MRAAPIGEDLRPDDAEPDFEPLSGDEPGPAQRAGDEPLFVPSGHTETVDPRVCRVLLVVGAVACVLGICLPSCFAMPLIVGGGVLAGVAHAFRERRYSHFVLGLAVLSLLLHGVATMARGCARGGHGVVNTYERYLEDD